ncbi:MAG: hypothetical protein P9L97_13100 [Candidatus Tenebribacter davisii]|nr:hypothetical protein [Candidatus Tenebribacter davisii]
MKKLLVIVLLGLLASSAFANVDFYGSVRLGYWYDMMDKDMTGGESHINMDIRQYSTSKLGANFTTNNIVGKAEFGFNGTTVYTRLFNAKVDLRACELLVGQDYTGFNLSNAASQSTSILLGYENLLIGYGVAYDGRQTMIKLNMKNGLYVSFTKPKKVDAFGIGIESVDALMPKINLGFNYNNNDLGIYPTFGFNMSKYNKELNVMEKDDTVMQYVFATSFKFKLSKLVFKGQVNYGQNMADFGINTSTFAKAGVDVEGKIVNATTMGGFLQACYTLDCGKITTGGGYISSSSDNLTDSDTGMSAFLQGNFKIHKAISVIPEVGLIDDMEDGMGTVEGSILYFGTKLQMDF